MERGRKEKQDWGFGESGLCWGAEPQLAWKGCLRFACGLGCSGHSSHLPELGACQQAVAALLSLAQSLLPS